MLITRGSAVISDRSIPTQFRASQATSNTRIIADMAHGAGAQYVPCHSDLHGHAVTATDAAMTHCSEVALELIGGVDTQRLTGKGHESQFPKV